MERKVDREKIETDAKALLDKFAKALEKVEKEHDIVSYVDRDEFERIEGDGTIPLDGFKDRILNNAPQHDHDFIIGEQGDWK